MDKPGAGCRAEGLCALLEAAHSAGNRALDELARRRRPEALCAACPPFVFAAARGQPRQAVPAEHFHRPYALALATVELTLNGYCLVRKFGWERRREAVFSLARPRLWRRLLRLAPPLVLRFSVRDGAVAVSVGAAGRRAAPDPRKRHILLAPDLQEALLGMHRQQIAANSFRTRFRTWMRT
jgi:hypothetical protein